VERKTIRLVKWVHEDHFRAAGRADEGSRIRALREGKKLKNEVAHLLELRMELGEREP